MEDLRRMWLSGVYQRYAKDVFNVICFRLRQYGLDDAADDLLQEVFLTAMDKCGSLVSHPDIRRWLFATASNKAMNYGCKRANEKRRTVWTVEPDDTEQIPDPSAEIALERILDEEIDCEDVIRRVKDSLTKPEQLLYAQAYEANESPAELSMAYGISEAAMRMRISRLRKRILVVVKNILQYMLQGFIRQII